MSEPVKIAIVIEGGMVQAVLTAGVPVECAVIDYDHDGCEGTIAVPQPNGETAEALPIAIWPTEDSQEGRRLVQWAHGLNACPDCGARYEGEDYYCPSCSAQRINEGQAPHDVAKGRSY